MLDPKSQSELKEAIGECIGADASVLDVLRAEIRSLKPLVRRIQPRTTTSISLVGTDGGNNQLQFDPFLIQMIRVVDSSDNQYCLEVVSPTTPVSRLVRRHLDETGAPIAALGEMMSFLGVRSLPFWFYRGSFCSGYVDYSYGVQLSHRSLELFIADLRKVWLNVADVSDNRARLVFRFGAINDRALDPRDVISQTLRGTPWRLRTIVHAGTARLGKRQLETFVRGPEAPIIELDAWAARE